MKDIKHYKVTWECDAFAASPEQAALALWKRYFDQGHNANVFDVTDENGVTVRVDLEELEG